MVGIDRTHKSARVPSLQRTAGNTILYGVIALIAFLCGGAVLSVLLWKAEVLIRLGLIGQLYYVALVPLGLCAAAFLFGVERSFARYTGKQLGGTLELGGAIVAAVLVVAGGFILIPKPPSTFPLTVYVHGEAGRSDLVLRNHGHIFIDLDGDRQSRSIGENGEAYFPAIPDHFRGQQVTAWVEAAGFESTEPNKQHRVDGGSLYLSVRNKSGRIVGRVEDHDGNPIARAEVYVADLTTRSNASGYFELSVPGDKLKGEMDLKVLAVGYKTRNYKVVPDGNELVATLSRSE